MFRAELAYELTQLGYQISRTGEQGGRFVIEGISSQILETYSQRAKRIETYMKEHGLSGAKAAALATLKTRPAKHSMNRDTLNEVWRVRSQDGY